MTTPLSFDLRGTWSIEPFDGTGHSRRGPAEYTIPGDWHHILGHAFQGSATVSRTIPIDAGLAQAHADDRLWIDLDSVATELTASINGRPVGHHAGDFVPIRFEIPWDAVATGSARIDLRIDEVHANRPAPGVLTENGHITKGFKDVLSLQHAGVWGGVSLRRTGPVAIEPDGVHLVADPADGSVIVRVETDRAPGWSGRGRVIVSVREVGGATRDVATADAPLAAGETELRLRVESPKPWSPDAPALYAADVRVECDGRTSDAWDGRFGFRRVEAGGTDGTRILINGVPTLIRGILHWGHEPRHTAPAPTPDEVRDQFAGLRELGFNAVCLCMVYLPRWFYDIADETGMLLWQEHPIWKSDMAEEHLPEFRRLCDRFFRRDRNHPSIVIVSGSCEHEGIHPDLAVWWWTQSARHHPLTLRQVQTAFTAWVNPAQTDLLDEHVYDNSGRWTAFLRDMRAEVRRLGNKPFVMGETIIANAWPDVPAMRQLEATHATPAAAPGPKPADARWIEHSPWYLTKGLAGCEAFERGLEQRYGRAGLDRFRAHTHRFGIEFRRWQVETFRLDPGNAGFVLNHIRDVPACRCGFMDDLDRWRYGPADTRPWLADRVFLFHTPGSVRAFAAPADVKADLCVSNFGTGPVSGEAHLTFERPGSPPSSIRAPFSCPPGDVARAPISIPLPAADAPTRLAVSVNGPEGSGVEPASWGLWAFPPADEMPPDVVRLDGLPYSRAELEPTFEERGYSSGWGLKCATWKPTLPDLSRIAFKCPLVRFDAPLPAGTRLVITNRLTRRLIEFAASGGRVVSLAHRAAGGFGAKTVMLWGQVPLIIDDAPWWGGDGPLTPGDAAWALDLLHHELNAASQFAVPSDDLGLAPTLDPVIRYVYTHDSGLPKVHDAAAWTRVGDGVLLVSALDHSGPAGRWLLRRFVEASLNADAVRGPDRRTDPAKLEPHACV
ncbi:MAG: hypothetical protein HRU70_01250 [Phycisphaeraceae bacterium]|nr:MAG: hypothetical protein HRU70_01250 [Phycisphaeraceae bacterium]